MSLIKIKLTQTILCQIYKVIIVVPSIIKSFIIITVSYITVMETWLL